MESSSKIHMGRWPNEFLEVVETCPICRNKNIKVLESGLLDWMSVPPTGLWSVCNCVNCGIAFLSPRPVKESISAAYTHYYTHSSEKDDLVHERLRAFKNFFSETYFAIASNNGAFIDWVIYLIIRILFPISLYLDAKSRHIFKGKRKPGRLLDVGCGNGEFLRFADKFGWNVVGVDFDEVAVAEAKSGGLDVSVGGIEVIDSEERFDFISLSHVIEHVYNPGELIRTCYSLLNDGGTLWLETPNIESAGYAIYKSNWRGLEPPRHIMIFNQAALNEMLVKSGFMSIQQKNHGLSGVYMGLSSERLLEKKNPCNSMSHLAARAIARVFRVSFLELMQLSSKKRREFLTLVATR